MGFTFPEELKALLRETNGDHWFLLSAEEIINHVKTNREIFPEYLEPDEFEEKVNKIIASFDGAVFPKLNWSSPKDAAWINFGSTLKCTSATDILVLLKASDFINHDIYAP